MSKFNKNCALTLLPKQVFRLSHVVLVIIGKSTFWYLQKLLEILHLKIQKSCTKAKLKTKLKVKKVLHCDSLKTTGFIRVKLWKLFKECHFFHKRMDVLRKTTTFLWKEYVMCHKSFLKWQFFCCFLALFLDLKTKWVTFLKFYYINRLRNLNCMVRF